MNTKPTTGGAESQTVIAVETSPAGVPAAWLNFLRQRLDVLHIDYTHVGPGRIHVMAAPHAAESVMRLVNSVVECADQYCRTALRSVRGHGSDTT